MSTVRQRGIAFRACQFKQKKQESFYVFYLLLKKMSTKYKATTTEEFYFSSSRNYAQLDNDLEVIVLYLF